MPNHRRLPSIDEAAWHLTAAECRLMLAMRDRPAEDDPGGGAVSIDRLIDDLGLALARLRDAFGDAGAPDEISGSAASLEPSALSIAARVRS
jgi:hypothetical protein